MRRALGLALLLAVVVPARVAAGATPPAEDLAELQARLAKILSDTHTPGLGVVIANRAGVLWTAGIGLADVAAAKPATPETLFHICSISKMFVAFAVLKLVEEGRLGLDARVRDLVPEIPFTNRWERTDPVRVVHLLEHTTGWDEIHPKEIVNDDPKPLTLSEGLALGPDSRVSRWRPGTRHAYCNSGPAVAAAIVEKLTGRRFEDYVRDTFFDPLGMTGADYFNSPHARPLLAQLYRPGSSTPLPYRNFALRPSGAINASARDMGAALLLLLRRGQSENGRLLAETSIRRMETPQTTYGAQAGLTIGYGLANGALCDDRMFVWRGHDGAYDGARSELFYLPEQGVGYFFAINSGNDQAVGRIGLQLMAYVTKDLAPPVAPPAQRVASGVSDAYAGWYVPSNPQVEARAVIEEVLGLTRLTFQETGLVIRPLLAPPVTASAVEGTRFRRAGLSVPNIVLVDTPEGRFLVRNESVFAKVSALHAWAEIGLLVLLMAAVVSVPLLAAVQGARWVLLRKRPREPLRRELIAVCVLPLVTWLCMAAALRLTQEAIQGGAQAVPKFGYATAWSVGLTAAIWGFAVSSVASLVAAGWAWRRGRNAGRGFVHYHGLVVAILFVIATLVLAFHGIIGYRSWA